MPIDTDNAKPAQPAVRRPTQHLSPRELSCLHWAAQGKTSVEIGLILGISTHTVNFHILNASRRLGVYGRQAAITVAWHAGLLPSSTHSPACHETLPSRHHSLTRLPHSGKIARPQP